MDQLDEKDFVQEDKAPPPNSYWLTLWIVIGILGIFWLGASRLYQGVKSDDIDKPFLQVTNREFSLFLWQNTEFMKLNFKEKTGYLPGFYGSQKVTPKAETADQYVAAPAEVLFRYHVWKRLIGSDFISRPVPLSEFAEFLAYDDEWLPKNWPNAPKNYRDLIESLDKMPKEDLTQLPQAVRMAFIGWKNFYKEGDSINEMEPTYADIKNFLDVYPGYGRSYWRNIVPFYLASLSKADPQAKVPREELPSFLRVALFNFKKGK